MNGRLYDPKLHRFLQPDNYVQDPTNTQNYNRYGYVLNNPLRYTDPSGEIIYNMEQALPSMGKIDLSRMGVSSGGGFGSNYGNGFGGSAFGGNGFGNGVTNNRNIYAIGAAVLANSPNPTDINKGTTTIWNNMGDGYFYSKGIGSVNFSGTFFAGNFDSDYSGGFGAIFTSLPGSFRGVANQPIVIQARTKSGTGQGGGGGYDLGYIGNVLGAGGTAFSGLENAVANKYWWMDAKGNYNSAKILARGEDGKYLKGFRGIAGKQLGYNSALKAANGYRVAGNIVGGLGLLVTGAQLYNNQITITEASFDAAFGIIGFMGPIGAGISGTYFIGKLGYEYFSGRTVFTKPR